MSPPTLRVDQEQFLAAHWQRAPLFIPGGVTDFIPPADADELAGLAMEPDCDARIVRCSGGRWTQQTGPFTETDLQIDGAWSLLVQSVDHYWQDAAALFHLVNFLPRWRFADVMMSYASDGGGAGPHYDNYDVFIIQGEGRRTWELGQRCDDQSPLQADADMRILAQFRRQSSYTLECGDVLYIPPGVAHRGVSHGDSTSFSLGFRAPRLSDLLARWVDNTLADIGDALLLQDAGRAPAAHAGEITREDVQRARRQLLALADEADPRWFGEALTEQQVAQEIHSAIAGAVQGCTVALAPGAHLAWYRGPDQLLVFAGGQTQPAPLALQPVLETLCSGDAVEASAPGGEAEGLEGLLQWLQDTNTVLSFDDE